MKINFEATVARDELVRALELIKGTVPKYPERHAADRGVLLESVDGGLSLSSSDAKGLTRVSLDATVGGPGEALIDYTDLTKAVNQAPADHPVALHEITWMRLYATPWFRRYDARTQHAVTVDGERFRTELGRTVRVAGTNPQATRYFGVRLWFVKHGVILQSGDDRRMTLAHVPGQVDGVAVGRSALLQTVPLATTLPGLTGPTIDLGVSLGADTGQVSIASGTTSLLAIASPAAPFGGTQGLSATPAFSVTVSRIITRNTLGAAEQRAGWVTVQPRPVVVHVDTNPVRVTYRGEPDGDRGRILAFDAVLLREALNTFAEQDVTLHVEDSPVAARVIVTASDTTLGDLSSGRHHLIMQIPDPRSA